MQHRSQPRQRPSLLIGRIAGRQPVSDADERLVEKGKSRLGAAAPAAKRGRIGYAIRVFERRRGFFPGIVVHKAASQGLTTRQQAVMGVRERKQWKKSEGLPATSAATPTNPDPVVMLVVRLFAAASVADDRITFTSRASSQNDFVAARGPIRFELVWRDAKWDKQNRRSSGLCYPALTCQDLSRKRSSSLSEGRPPTGREYSFSAMACGVCVSDD